MQIQVCSSFLQNLPTDWLQLDVLPSPFYLDGQSLQTFTARILVRTSQHLNKILGVRILYEVYTSHVSRIPDPRVSPMCDYADIYQIGIPSLVKAAWVTTKPFYKGKIQQFKGMFTHRLRKADVESAHFGGRMNN